MVARIFSTIGLSFSQFDNRMFKISGINLTFVTVTQRMMFRIDQKDSSTSARAGVLRTAHGDIPTPVFMPVGTAGTVKGVLHRDLRTEIDASGVEAIEDLIH